MTIVRPSEFGPYVLERLEEGLSRPEATRTERL
jgi:hypothetical protein